MFEKISFKKISIILISFLAIELLSYLALFFPILNYLIFSFLVLSVIALSFFRLEYGLLIVLAEVFVGSMGHLFVIPLGSYVISIRIALWLALMSVFIVKFIWQLIKNKKNSFYFQSLKSFNAGKYFALLALFVVISLVNAYFRGHELTLIYSDFNSWLYFLLILPSVCVYNHKNIKTFLNLKTLFLAAVIWTSLKTLILVFIFTHNLVIASEIYFWLRKTLMGEMTATLSGWPRIFIQGQIFSAVAFLIIFWAQIKKAKTKFFVNPLALFLSALLASTILISFSRSFWVAAIVAYGVSLILIWIYYSFKDVLHTGLWILISYFFGFILIYLVAIFPYPSPGQFNADFISRVSNGGESALTSRWSLLPVLMTEIGHEPILAQGFGATITYKSSDPRVLAQNPNGDYTTYAFEWGYLDLWLKLGLLGLLSYLLLLGYLIKKAVVYGHKNDDLLLFGLASGIVFLAVTNFFTPYLNHPLGIVILLLGACLIRKDRVY